MESVLNVQMMISSRLVWGGVASGKMNYEDLLDWVKNHEVTR